MTRTLLAALAVSLIGTAAWGAAAQGKGEVQSVDASKGTISISHEAIPALKWPAMTMPIGVKDKALLSRVKPGQSIVFDLEKDPAVGYVITRIETSAK